MTSESDTTRLFQKLGAEEFPYREFDPSISGTKLEEENWSLLSAIAKQEEKTTPHQASYFEAPPFYFDEPQMKVRDFVPTQTPSLNDTSVETNFWQQGQQSQGHAARAMVSRNLSPLQQLFKRLE